MAQLLEFIELSPLHMMIVVLGCLSGIASTQRSRSVQLKIGNNWHFTFSLGNDDHKTQLQNQSHSSRLSTVAKPAANVPHSGEYIRLRGTRGFMNYGIIEVYRAGRWGLVCDDDWDIKDANVACRQLGFKQGATAAPGEAYYGLASGRWDEKDIIMDNVNCQGDELSLQHCHYDDNHDCTVQEAASVVCKPNSGCPAEWVPGLDSCYRFFTGAANINAASSKCSSLGASLLSIESVAENHFLSNLIMLAANQTDGNHLWFTAGRDSYKGSWKWFKTQSMKPTKNVGQKQSRKFRGSNRNTKIQMKHVQSPVDLSLWFPGWLPLNHSKEPVQSPGHECLALSDLFTLADGILTSADYYFWKTSTCHFSNQALNFICELHVDQQPEDCYTGRGVNYRGFVASTERGTPCISWQLTSINSITKPGKGLGNHNYCRNPDGDVRPWCWVGNGRFGFCSILQCSMINQPTTNILQAAAPHPDCPADEFFCPKSQLCLLKQFRCDGEEDCKHGEDEADCDYNINNFEKFPDRMPHHYHGNLTYFNVPLETCATFCLRNTLFTCLSFLFNNIKRRCEILNRGGLPVYISVSSPDNDYYILKNDILNCTNRFRCANGRCLEPSLVCNGRDNCEDMSDEMQCGTTPSPMKVRLVGGAEHSGRVEVNYLGEWGTICDDQWDIKDAIVVCRMLGYPGAVRASLLAEFGVGASNMVLDEMNCLGNETSIQYCSSSSWKQHDCQSFETAGVECLTRKTCELSQYTCANKSMCIEARNVCDGVPSCPAADDEANCKLRVELVNGTKRHEGRVELIRNGVRGTVCDDDWDKADADVICRMLGYRYGGEPLNQATFGAGNGVIWLDNVQCQGKETMLDACKHSDWALSDCSHQEDAGVRCYLTLPTTTTTPLPTTMTTTKIPDKVKIYLVGGSRPNEGRIELDIGGIRGTICDDSWDFRDARVVCRMLGYNDGGVALSEAAFGQASSTTSILLDEVHCLGNETDILKCRHLGVGNHNCYHTEDAGVICSVKEGGGQTPTDGRQQTLTIPSSTKLPPTSISDQALCGLRPLDNLHRRQRRDNPDTDFSDPLRNRTWCEVEPLRTEKIMGGTIAEHGFFPWQAGIKRIYNIYANSDMLVGHVCGATIINQHWVLSAAHCFTTLTKSRMRIRVGDHGLKTKDEGEDTFEVEELIPHKNYISNSHDYDVALLKIKSKDGQGFKFGDYVQPACLPTVDTSYAANTSCYISGWGETGGGNPTMLRAASVPLLPFTVCNYLYKGALTPRMLCAGYLKGGIDTCQGDSGGPLVCKINDVYTLMGITSWGFGCAKPNSPGIYTRTSEFLSWITNTIQQNS